MTQKCGEQHLLSIPENAGREIVESAFLMACPLMGTEKFAKFCKNRGLQVDRLRLLRLERLGLFSPVFRVCNPKNESGGVFNIPIRDGNNWFAKGWAWDTTSVPATHQVPSDDDFSQEGYYSIFQVEWLRHMLDEMTLSVNLDSHIGDDGGLAEKYIRSVGQSIEWARSSLERSRNHSHRRSIGLLCQCLSNRYYPKATGDQRSIRTGNASSTDRWISVGDPHWIWEAEARKWNPKRIEVFFELTPERLKRAYETLASAQSWIDPLERWYPLIQFISIDDRRRLKGTALLAETIREGALMLRSLYVDLYGEELPPPNEVHGTVITHIPELEIRKDVRRYLEFVVNDYGINPQPKLVLFLEGKSEERVVERLFDGYFGFPASRAWIEILVMQGVDNVTGGRRDSYGAILRLVDYLHHHQTIAFILLDNENNAKRLKEAATESRSIFGRRHRITRPEYIRVWRRSFEFDNFSDTEIAAALSEVTEGRRRFRSAEVAACRRMDDPGSALSRLFKEKMDYGLPKIPLSEILVAAMLAPNSRKAISNRPIVKVLERVVALAIRNPFPVMQEIWERNQASKVLAKKR